MSHCAQTSFVFAALVLSAAFAAPLRAQCGTSALPGAAVPGPATGKVYATIAWDPDGSGPLPERLVIGGDFTIPSIRTSYLASYDFATGDWQPLGLGVSHPVNALAVLPSGDLVAAGGFVTAGGTNTLGIARWDGSNWHSFGNGLPGSGRTIVVMPNGNLVVGCRSAAGQPNLVRWDGVAWTQFAGYLDGSVEALALAPNGDLYAGGGFAFAGGVLVGRAARWDGVAWHSLGFGLAGTIDKLVLRPNGELVVGGFFLYVGNPPIAASRIASWNGTTWSPLADGSVATIGALHVVGNGDLIAAGEFQPPGVIAFNMGRWDGTQWHRVGRTGFNAPSCFCSLANGDLVAGGDFVGCEGVVVDRVACRHGATWQALGTSPDNRVLSLAYDAAGELHVGGTFLYAGGRDVHYLARVHGGVWEQPAVVSSPTIAYHGPVESIVRLANGQLAATSFGGYSDRGIAFWDGQAWTPTTATVNYDVRAIAQLPNGDVVIGGDFSGGTGLPNGHRVARLVGNTWQAVGSQMHSHRVRSLLALPNGDLIAGGEFLQVDAMAVNHVARWDGSNWGPMGSGLGTGYYDTVRCLARLPNGDVVAGGTFTSGTPAMDHIARFDGTAWSPLGTGLSGGVTATAVNALLVLPDGDLLVGGDFTTAGGVPVHGVARWDGAAWRAVDPGVDGIVYAMTMSPDGDVLLGGDFARAGNVVSGHLARIRSACAAASTPFGAGCANGLGTAELVVRDLPWLGGAARATCEQVPASALGFAVRGFTQTAVPLSLYHPAAGIGCLQLVSQDSVVWLYPDGNRVTTLLSIPNDAGLLGVQVREQVVIAELSPSLAITGLTSSNGVSWTIGAW